jgi:hypothetical protein
LKFFAEGAMRDYRAYIMGPDGHIKDRIEFWSKDDETAKKQAEQCVDGHDIELWHQDKKIADLKTSSKTASDEADSSTAAPKSRSKTPLD